MCCQRATILGVVGPKTKFWVGPSNGNVNVKFSLTRTVPSKKNVLHIFKKEFYYTDTN